MKALAQMTCRLQHALNSSEEAKDTLAVLSVSPDPQCFHFSRTSVGRVLPCAYETLAVSLHFVRKVC